MTDEKKTEPIVLPVPTDLLQPLRAAQVRFDKASRVARAAMTAATEGGAVSIVLRQQAIVDARAAIEEFGHARAVLSTVEEKLVIANKLTDSELSKQRDRVERDAEAARHYVSDELARLDAQEAALRDLKGPIGQS
jgi:hypothetical protein